MQELSTPIQETSALGAYWKALRFHLEWTQEDLVARLRAKGLMISVKQVWSWEKGQNAPTSVSKATMDEVLGGNPVLSDQLLLFDTRQRARIEALTDLLAAHEDVLHAESTEPTPCINGEATAIKETLKEAENELRTLATSAVELGKREARQWIKTREQQEILRRAADAVPDDMVDEARAILADLYDGADDRARRFLEFGRFLRTGKSS